MLSRGMRLRKARDFRAVFVGRGRMRGQMADVQRVVSNERMTIHIGRRRTQDAEAGQPGLRFGFTISKKTAKRAHDRNRIKRRLSEIVRLEVAPIYSLSERYDCVVVARPGTVTADYAALRLDLLALLESSGLIKLEISATPQEH